MISNYGRLYSIQKASILSPRTKKNGYVHYRLYKDGKCYYVSAHRLVAFAFVENPCPDEYNTINHKDENPSKNFATNLEWCDTTYNLNYKTAQKRRAAKRSIPVQQVSSDGRLIAEYESLNATSRETKFPLLSLFNACHSEKLYKNCYWRYAPKEEVSNV